ncbi:MAG TPA: O-methyltransferase [Thermoplasmata archaeon]|nr:O-methyltransferase [Thermoplasmata archaeon]
MVEPVWTEVDDFFETKLLGDDPALAACLRASAEANLPEIQVSPVQGRLLHLIARAHGARRILEVGTLGGYSAICLARALPPDGRLITLEIEPKHAEVARANIEHAGLSDRVEIRLGPALDTLPKLEEEGAGPFDLFFLDADRPNNRAYLGWILRLAGPGAVLVVDNVVRRGGVVDATSDDANVRGIRDMVEALAREPRITATAIQTVGRKGYDGFILGRIDGPFSAGKARPSARRRR